MFQYAVERITPIFPLERILVVTRADHGPILMEQVPELPGENFILEPEGRGTAPAIGLAAIHLYQRDPNAVMAILTADHFISNTDNFCKVLVAAGNAASDGSLVTLGIRPSSPATGFGYIEQGHSKGDQNGFEIFSVERFTEKPDLSTAEKMVTSGVYSWNSGMFIWRVDTIIDEFKRQMPAFYQQLSEVSDSLGTPDYPVVLDRIWPAVGKQTIDYGIMENAHNLVVIPVEIGWYDIGSWDSLFDLLPVDGDGNISRGNHLGIDTKNTLVFGGERLIATLGVDDLVIIDTEDALMVCARDRVQDVKAVVEKFKGDDKERLI